MTYYRLAEPNAAHEDFDGESVMLDLETGKYFSLSRSASFIVETILGGASLDETIARCAGAEHLGRAAVTGLLQLLVAYRLIEQSKTSPAGSGLEKAASVPVDEPPVVEVFDDLADLIMADPIHEVDEERGWPIRKAND